MIMLMDGGGGVDGIGVCSQGWSHIGSLDHFHGLACSLD
jgi:hypothetical protein